MLYYLLKIAITQKKIDLQTMKWTLYQPKKYIVQKKATGRYECVVVELCKAILNVKKRQWLKV